MTDKFLRIKFMNMYDYEIRSKNLKFIPILSVLPLFGIFAQVYRDFGLFFCPDFYDLLDAVEKTTEIFMIYRMLR